jgi:hypothetical protein
MAVAVLENPVLFGMRLGAELDQLRQGAMAQAISQSLREALDLHTWRYGMIANLLAAYHRAQSPQEKAAYAALIAPLTEAAQEPKEQETVVPGVGVRIGYLPMTAVGRVQGGGVVQTQPQSQGQQGGTTQSNQPKSAEQQTAAPQTATTAQPAETQKLTGEQLQAVLEALALVDPLYGLVHPRLRAATQQTTAPEQQTESTAQPMQQQPVEEQGAEQLIPEERLSTAPQPQTETAAQPPSPQQVGQQTQGGLGEILQQQTNQQQPTIPAQPSPQQSQEHKYEPTAKRDWSGKNWWTDYSMLNLPQGRLGEILQRQQLPSEVYDALEQMVEQWIKTNQQQSTTPEQPSLQQLGGLQTIKTHERKGGIWWERDDGPMVYIPEEVVAKINDTLLPLVFPWYHQLKDNPRVRESLSRILWQGRGW